MYKITIILPTFNVEGYLKRAFNSLLTQSIGFTNLQIIFVDDCSTDNSRDIIDAYANTYDNVFSIHLPTNSGAAGKPRNVGITYAMADYLLFLDPDDYLLKDACKTLYDHILKSNTDIVVGGYAKTKEFIVPWNSYSNNKKSLIKTPSKNISIFMNPPGLSAKLFKKQLIVDNNISFPEYIPGQDLVFITECFLNAKSVLSLNDFIVYCYYHARNDENSKSISNNVTKKYLYNILKAYILTLDLLEKFNVDNNLRNLYFSKHHIGFFISQLKKSTLTKDEINQLFSSFDFNKFSNQKYITENKNLEDFFDKLVKDYESVNINELNSIWNSAIDTYAKSKEYNPEVTFNGNADYCFENNVEMQNIENKISNLYKKNANINNIMSKK